MTQEEFADLFDACMQTKREEMRQKFDRVLPSGEYIFNRFDKNEYLGFGKGSSVYDTSVIMGDVKVGDHVWIGPYTLLDGSAGKLTIGDFVSIDSGVMIYTHDSTKYYVSGGKNPFVSGAVTIGSYVVVGTMSMISCGVTIGDHSVIAAHSFVNEDVPPYRIAAGNPAKIIGEVVLDEEGRTEFRYFHRRSLSE